MALFPLCALCVVVIFHYLQIRSYTFGVLNRDFDLMKMVRTKLNAILPANAHELCTGRLRISVTRFRDMENVILDEFCTKDELIDVFFSLYFILLYWRYAVIVG